MNTKDYKEILRISAYLANVIILLISPEIGQTVFKYL